MEIKLEKSERLFEESAGKTKQEIAPKDCYVYKIHL